VRATYVSKLFDEKCINWANVAERFESAKKGQ